jgi:hypothetical protein
MGAPRRRNGKRKNERSNESIFNPKTTKMINKIRFWIIYQVNTMINYFNYWWMKKEADRLHKTTGKRYHVVPAGPTKLMVVDNNWIKLYNQSLPKNKRITINDLLKMSYYSTPLQGLNREKK